MQRRHPEILIGERAIGNGSPVFVVADIGTNHGGSVSEALKLIDAAAECGADAIKFQTFRTERPLRHDPERVADDEGAPGDMDDMFHRLELCWAEYETLKRHADARGIIFLSTPFDEGSADFLDQLGVPAFKVASADLTHAPLLRRIAAKGKPVLLSTGMSFLGEVADALWTLRSGGADQVLLLHCVSCFPALPESMNLRCIETLKAYFNLPVGFSDHSEGILLPIVAVSLGADLLQKRFTLDKSAHGPDHRQSADPEEFRLLVQSIRAVEASLGSGRKSPAPAEAENRLLARRSIVAAVDIRARERIAPWMLALKRPGTGLEPRHLERVVGMRARRNIGGGTILQWDDLAPSIDTDELEPATAAAPQHAG